MASYLEARDSIFEAIYGIWQPTGYDIQWPDKVFSKPDEQVPFARVTLNHEDGYQASLVNHHGQRIWERRGTLFVQIFTPLGQGNDEAYGLAKMLIDMLQKLYTSAGVMCRNVRLNEVGQEDYDFFQVNVVADFTYEEIA